MFGFRAKQGSVLKVDRQRSLHSGFLGSDAFAKLNATLVDEG